MRVGSDEETNFYEIGAAQGNWSMRTLQRQYGSSLFERILLGTGNDKVFELSTKGHVVQRSEDAVRDLYAVELLVLQKKQIISEFISSYTIGYSDVLC